MIGLERPEALLMALAAGPLLWWWHRRQQRPRAVSVSSLLIWERLGVATETASRRRRSWLLALEAAAALALILAAAGPYRSVTTPPAAQLTVLVDRRPGMGAVDATGRTRLARARDQLRKHLGTHAAGARVRLLTVPPAPGGARTFTAGTAEADAALATLAVATLTADFDAAVARLEAHGGRRLVVTDEPPPIGGRPSPGRSWLSVGAPGRNLGLIWATVERSDAGPSGLSVGVMNGGTEAATARVTLRVEGRDLKAAAVTLAPGEVRALPVFSLGSDALARGCRVSLEGRDALAADDTIAVRPAARRHVSLVAAEAVPPPVRAALAALGAPPVEVPADDPAPAPPALYWKVAPGPAARPPWVWVGCEGDAAGLRLGPGYRPSRVEAGPDATTVGGLETTPRRVVRALRVSGTAPDGATPGWRTRLLGLDPSGRRVPLVLDRADGAAVLAFDPVRDAPAWSDEPTFPAFFFAALGRAAGGLTVEGLLSPADTRLGPEAVAPSPPAPTARTTGASEGRESFAVWLLLASALALAGICLLEV